MDWSHYQDGLACFYGSLYINATDVAERSELNTETEKVKDNIRNNLSLGLQEVTPHQKQDTLVYLLAGGPSLSDYEQQIIEAGKSGVPCVTVNGTYNWLLDRGVKPAAMVMVDARELNKRFVERPVDTCKYFLSSQCDHELVKSLPSDRTWLWHSADSQLLKEIAEETGISHSWFPVVGGSTVVSRALCLLVMLGYRKVEIFGWDSCIREGKHHAYEQPENDMRSTYSMRVGGREFKCHPWMMLQAFEFQNIVTNFLAKFDDFEMIVHGDGLIAAIINHAAELADEE